RKPYRPGKRSGGTGMPRPRRSTRPSGPRSGVAPGAVDRGDDRLERGGRGVGVDADTPQDPAVVRPADLALHVAGRLGVAARAHRVLHVVEHADVEADVGERVAEGGDRAVAHALDLPDLAVDPDV